MPLLDHNPDIKELLDENFKVGINNNLVSIQDVEYLNKKRELKKGTLLSKHGNIGEKLTQVCHSCYFLGEMPCDEEGNKLEHLLGINGYTQVVIRGIGKAWWLSIKPKGKFYSDFHQKFHTYIYELSKYVELKG